MKKLITKEVSFDFDSTLSRKDVQDYAAHLIKEGYDVWITTSRFDEENKHRFRLNPTNEDMYKVVDALGIPREKIVFTNRELKSGFFVKDFVWHLDDDWVELNFINRETDVVGISVVGGSNWKKKCNKLLK